MEAVIEKSFEIEEPIDKVWANLSNPMEVASCVPGAAITQQIDDTHYKGEVTLKFGPIKAQFEGDIEMVELDSSDYRMVMSGKGLDSKGKGSADMIMNGDLQSSDKGTNVNFKMTVIIVGTIAQFGSRLINDVSDQLLKQFIANFKAQLAGQEFDNNLNAGSMMGSVLKSKIGGMFKGKDEFSS
jgi:hypothetical protein